MPDLDRPGLPRAEPAHGSTAGPGSAGVVDDPVLALLLDPAALSRVVGRAVRVTRVRPKPGVSHVAALVDARSGAPVGWVQALVGEARVKREKAVQKVAEHRPGITLGEAALPELDALLLWGPVESDPRLARSLADVDLAAGTLLRYNPLRRVVLRLGDHVLRATAGPHRDRLSGVARALAAAGVPVTTPVPASSAGLSGGRRTTVWEWVEGRDLSAETSPAQLAGAGALLARLHAVPVGAVPGLPQRGWAEVRDAAAASVAQVALVAPELAGPLRRALDALPLKAPSEGPDPGADVVLHGDFSLDQCLAGEEGLLLTDLDRAAVGPAEIDLASALAVALVDDVDLEPLLVAYRAAAGWGPTTGRRPSAPWVAAALLSRAAEPWRAQQPGWAGETRRRARLALGLLGEDEAWTVPSVVEDRSGDRVRVLRAWPDTLVDGVARVAVEGPDQHGRLRAGRVGTTGTVRLLPAGEDPRLPALSGLAPHGRLVVHRPGRRAVVALPDSFVKVVRPGRAAQVAELSRRGAELAAAAGLGAARVLSADEDTVAFSVLPGRPVHELSEDPGWETVWSLWAQAWVRLQAAGSTAATDLPQHAPTDEAGLLHTWRRRALDAGVLTGTPWPQRLAATAEELAATAPGTRLVPAHRDLHDKQLLWDGTTLSVLDLDTASRAEPALDLANLAVHARLRHAQGLWSAGAAQVVLDAVTLVAESSGAAPDRLRLAERATVARLAAVYAFRPPWRDTVLRWAGQEWDRTLPGR